MEEELTPEQKETTFEIAKAREAMDCLLMAYSAMIDYTFDGAHEIRAAVMEIIHALEHELTQQPLVEIETAYDDDDLNKEIVVEGGQYCVRSKDGSRSFGCYISRNAAEERLAQIESFSEKLKALTDKELGIAYKATAQVIEKDATTLVYKLAEEELENRNPLTLLELYERGDFDDFIQDQEHPAVVSKKQKDIPLATILKSEQRFTMGPVYVPNLEDAHGETIDASELQTAIWDWVRKGDRTIYLQHSEKPAGEMVEILTMPFPIETALTVPNEGVTKYSFPENTPFMGVIWEEWAWELVKAGELRGYSIGGQAQIVEVDLPESLAL